MIVRYACNILNSYHWGQILFVSKHYSTKDDNHHQWHWWWEMKCCQDVFNLNDTITQTPPALYGMEEYVSDHVMLGHLSWVIDCVWNTWNSVPWDGSKKVIRSRLAIANTCSAIAYWNCAVWFRVVGEWKRARDMKMRNRKGEWGRVRRYFRKNWPYQWYRNGSNESSSHVELWRPIYVDGNSWYQQQKWCFHGCKLLKNIPNLAKEAAQGGLLC